MAVTEGVDSQGLARVDRLDRMWRERPGLTGWLTTTDHKRIGLMYLVTSLAFFAAGGVEALIMRTQLATSGEHVVGPETYDQLMTMHGVTMIFFFVIPLSTGAFGNYLVPLMIGARDMAFPRMNALSFWLFLGSGILFYSGLAIGQAPDAGWFNYVPLASRQYSPGLGIDFYALGLILNGMSSTAAAANFLVTIAKMRAPGMSLNRMPLFCYANLAASFSLLFALPVLTTDLMFLELSRRFGLHFFDPGRGGEPLLWQDLFWFFGHPEVYIIVLPAFGIATSIIPTFTRRRMAAFPLVALAELLVAFIGFGVWVHHMFATGLPAVALVFFAAASLIIVIPSGIQIYAWCMTMVTGSPEFRTPLLFIVGFILFFVFGGLSGITLAAVPFDQQVTDTYYVVAHFHYVIWGAAVFPLLGGLYYWFPKVTGRMYSERAGQVSFWLVFAGTNITFFPMHISGLLGMPRRVYTYPGSLGWGPENLVSTLGAFLLTAGLVLIAVNLVVSGFRGAPAGPNPFGGATLEWTTSSPPPPYNFAVIPEVSSPYPAWDDPDREADTRRLERGELVLEHGHETPATTPVDGRLDEILAMPSDSPWPITLAAVTTIGFAMVLSGHLIGAAIMAALAAAALCAWHAREPEAVTTTAAPTPAPAHAARPNGWYGMLMLVATEATIFGALIATYAYLRFNTVAWPPRGVEAPGVTAPLILALVLLLTAAPIFLAVRAAAAGRRGVAIAMLSGAVGVQAAYLAVQAHLYADQLATLHPDANAYSSIYFTLLAVHHAHVAVGLLLELWIIGRLAVGWTRYRQTALSAIALYWYFVVVAGLAVTATVLYPAW